MNLNKLFNFKYLKQNLKKSRGQLVLFLSIVPIFTFLVLLLSLKNTTGNILKMDEISIINILGMYVIPIILSINLFGYVFKRKSVDFINSMPINRKSIFLSNTLGGIVLIILMQLINVIGIFLIGSVYSETIIFSSMVWDCFFIMTLSYIFVFVSSNIAMAVSGNKLTQIVVTLLILFLIPFTASSINQSFYGYKTEYNLIGNKDPGIISVQDEINETTPYRIIRMIFSGFDIDLLYNSTSLCKMGFLSIIYIFIGCYIFQRRKFENTEESFSNTLVHFIVKSLTIFPMIMVLAELDYLDSEIELILLCIAFISVYYFIYDIVTSKKIKLIPSVINLIITLILLNGICYGIINIREDINENKKINKDDIVGIAINIGRKDDGGYSTSDIMNYYMENEKLIDYVYKSKTEGYYRYYSEYNKYPVRIKLKNGKIYNTYLIIKTDYESEEKNLENLIEILSADEQYVKLYKEQYLKQGKYLLMYYKLTEENNEYFDKKISDYIEKATLKEIWKSDDSQIAITKYNYTNHRLMKTRIKLNFDKEVFDKAIYIINDEAKKYLNNEENEVYSIEINKYNTTQYIDLWDYKENVKEIILNEENYKIDLNSEYFVVYIYGKNGMARFYTQNEKIKEYYYLLPKDYEYIEYENEELTNEIYENVEIVNEIKQ